MKRSGYLLSIICQLLALGAYAQDHIYSQFFNSPIYLNPALTGQFEGDIRASMIYRNQWTSISGDLSYLSAAADINIPKFGGGIGLMFNRSSEGTAFLTKNNIAATYSYSVGNEDYVASFGVQGGFTNRKLDWNKLVFSDQIDYRLGYTGGATAAEMPPYNSKYYFDASGGISLVYRNFMLGTAMHHINKPDESFTGSKALLPRRLTLHASYRLPLQAANTYDSDGAYLIPSVVFYKQGAVSSLSAGTQFKYRGINAGAWYRSGGEGGPDAFVVSLIFDIFTNRYGDEKFRLGISHDATTSKLNYSNTSGTTEFSLGYEKYFPNSSNSNKFNGLRCYDFY